MQFNQKFILAMTIPDTIQITAFSFYPVKEVQEDDETVIEKCEAEEAEAYALYAVINDAETMWIGDAETEYDIKNLCGLLQSVYRAGVNRSHPLDEEKSFAGWTVSDLIEIAEEDDEELNEAEAGQIIDTMLNECNAGDGVDALLLSSYIDAFIAKRHEQENNYTSKPFTGNINQFIDELVKMYGEAHERKQNDSYSFFTNKAGNINIGEFFLEQDKGTFFIHKEG